MKLHEYIHMKASSRKHEW